MAAQLTLVDSLVAAQVRAALHDTHTLDAARFGLVWFEPSAPSIALLAFLGRKALVSALPEFAATFFFLLASQAFARKVALRHTLARLLDAAFAALASLALLAARPLATGRSLAAHLDIDIRPAWRRSID